MRRMIDPKELNQGGGSGQEVDFIHCLTATKGNVQTTTVYYGAKSTDGNIKNSDKAYEKIEIKKAEISERAEIGPDIQTSPYAYVNLTIVNNGFEPLCDAPFNIIDNPTLTYFNRNKPQTLYLNIYTGGNNPLGITNTFIVIGDNFYEYNADRKAYLLSGDFIDVNKLDGWSVTISNTYEPYKHCELVTA